MWQKRINRPLVTSDGSFNSIWQTIIWWLVLNLLITIVATFFIYRINKGLLVVDTLGYVVSTLYGMAIVNANPSPWYLSGTKLMAPTTLQWNVWAILAIATTVISISKFYCLALIAKQLWSSNSKDEFDESNPFYRLNNLRLYRFSILLFTYSVILLTIILSYSWGIELPKVLFSSLGERLLFTLFYAISSVSGSQSAAMTLAFSNTWLKGFVVFQLLTSVFGLFYQLGPLVTLNLFRKQQLRMRLASPLVDWLPITKQYLLAAALLLSLGIICCYLNAESTFLTDAKTAEKLITAFSLTTHALFNSSLIATALPIAKTNMLPYLWLSFSGLGALLFLFGSGVLRPLRSQFNYRVALPLVLILVIAVIVKNSNAGLYTAPFIWPILAYLASGISYLQTKQNLTAEG